MNKKILCCICLGAALLSQNVFAESYLGKVALKFSKTSVNDINTNGEKTIIGSVIDSIFAPEEQDKPEVMPTYKYLPQAQDTLTAYKNAEAGLMQALTKDLMSERKAALIKAVEDLNIVYAKEKDSVSMLFLGSKIYRAYGVSSQAKKYYDKAIEECAKSLVQNMECRQAHLDLAVLFYAGESRYDKDYENYVQRAEIHANEALKQLKLLKKPDGRAYYQSAIAYFILGNKKEAKANLEKAIKEGYIKDGKYLTVCQDILNDEFKLYAIKQENAVVHFLAYGFGILNQ